MKKNNQGFMITEALIVSTIVLGVLVFMYAQFKSITNGFSQTFKYNTVENIYKTNEIKKFIETDATDNMISLLENSKKNYIDITECKIETYNNKVFCSTLYEKLGVKTLLLLTEDISSIDPMEIENLDNGTRKFLDYIKNNYTGNYHRIVVSYDDGTYATLRIDVLNDTYDFGYTGDVQTFTVAVDGYYQVELWGAQGEYTKGIIYLKKGTNLYVYVGVENSNEFQDSTDIRIVSGNYNNFNSIKSIIMLASGKIDGYYSSSSNVVSFISGYDGCDAITENSTADNIVHTGQSIHYSGYKFEYGEMIAGNSEMPNPSGGIMTGNSGNGFARITVISG